jgi:Gas vesicle protein K
MVRKAAATKRKATRRKPLKRPKAARSARRPRGPLELREIESLRGEIERVARTSATPRWNAKPDEVRRSVVKLVLTLVDFVRQLLERQALRRVDANTLTPAETEAIGKALMQLEATVRDLAAQFDLNPEDLNLDLGPIGKLV